jgi:tight adherence protein B
MATSPDGVVLLASVASGLALFLAVRWLWPMWDAFTRKHFEKFLPEWTAVGLDGAQLMSWYRWWAFGMFAVLVGCTALLGMFGLGVLLAGLIAVAPSVLIRGRLSKRRTLLRDQMVAACQGLSNAARAGLSLPQGMEAVSLETPEPLSHELRRIVGEYQRGRTLTDAMQDTQKRLRLESFTLFCSAILVCLDRGGRITEALDRIATSLQENQRLRRKLDADTASGRKVVLILGAFPFVFLGGFYLFDPDGTNLIFRTLLGQFVLVIVGVLDVLGVLWARKIMKLDGLGA